MVKLARGKTGLQRILLRQGRPCHEKMAASKADATAEVEAENAGLVKRMASLEERLAKLESLDLEHRLRFPLMVKARYGGRDCVQEDDVDCFVTYEHLDEEVDSIIAGTVANFEGDMRMHIENYMEDEFENILVQKLKELNVLPASITTTPATTTTADTTPAPPITGTPPPAAVPTPVDRYVFDYLEKEAHVWDLPMLPSPLYHKTVCDLKLVVHGYAFYSIVRDGKRIDFRVGDYIYNMLMKNAYTRVVIYHGYYKPPFRPYIVKEFMGAVVVDNGISISYPLMDVSTSGVTYGVKLGKTLEYFNPHSVEQQNEFLNSRLSRFILQQAEDTPKKSQVDYTVRRVSLNQNMTPNNVEVLQKACADGSPLRAYASPKLVRAFQERTGEDLPVEQVLERLKLQAA